MSLAIVRADYFRGDLEKQADWYASKGGLELARRYLLAVEETLMRLARQAETGRLRHFRHPELAGLRSHLVIHPFNRHIVFYRVEGECLNARRVMDGSRDLARRLAQAPSVDD